MADFKKAWDKTSKNEGGYVNNSRDAGKETYRGISIVHNPKWIGWEVVHKVIAGLGITDTLDAPKDIREKIDNALALDPVIDRLVQSLYKIKYWDPLRLDHEESQLIAEQVFDTAVNMGVETSRKFIEDAEKKENA